MDNSDIFWGKEEALNWNKRNLEVRNKDTNEFVNKLYDLISKYNLNTKNILYIGCNDGYKLSLLKKKYPNSNCYGIDISENVINIGLKKYPNLNLKTLSAYELDYFKNINFDIIIFGWCFCYFDPNKYDKILNDINNILKTNGVIFIYDFYSKYQSNLIKWRDSNHYIIKTQYSELFTVKYKNYNLINREILNFDNFKNEFQDINNTIVIDLIIKM